MSDSKGSTAGGRKVLACCCVRHPPSMRCALHQNDGEEGIHGVWVMDATRACTRLW